jgi:hypothetical protein
MESLRNRQNAVYSSKNCYIGINFIDKELFVTQKLAGWSGMHILR